MENGGLKTTISEESPTSEAPLYRLDVEVLPPPGEFSNDKTAAGARVAPIAAEDERLEEGSRVELASLVRDMGTRVNAKMSNIKTCKRPACGSRAEIEATSAVPLNSPEHRPNRAVIEAQNLAHLPAAPWCEICYQVMGESDWHTQVKFDCEIPCVQMDFLFIGGKWCKIKKWQWGPENGLSYYVNIACSLLCHSCPLLLCLFVVPSFACTEITMLHSADSSQIGYIS